MNEMVNELPTTYSPTDAEKKWYARWENGKYFKPRKGKQNKTFSIIMPPPNVTGRLHMGHALDATTQDALIRYKRMKGFETLWLPGSDHAGIATQSVVEKMVWEQEKKTRHDYGREAFTKKIWEWKKEYGDIITSQQRAIGAGPDWDYSLFTMDEHANQAVVKTFVELFNQKLIYQADYIVNWDPILHSAISDAEVEHKEVKGAFYHILYAVKGTDLKLEVATTRPETMLGDTAVAVNPNDERYKHLIGKMAIIPLCHREVPIIGDTHVDIETGTGCLKVTPGHDFNDFEIGRRHKLPAINILNKDGTLNEHGLEWKGLSCKKARPQIVKRLEESGELVKVVDHVHQVGHGERSNAIIEPMISKQWFVNVQEMAKIAVDAVVSDKTRFYPKGWENTYFAWLKEPKDWCISRQLWWGHQIPVFTCEKCQHQFAAEGMPSSCPKCSHHKLIQDPDVLDTWFSSGIWPLSTLGWPDAKRMQEKRFHDFYPTSVLVTGYDIIFFWVARMMMMCLKERKEIPFEKVYIHAIVRDKLGRKMSKSLGNGIDPLQMINEYGADALRFTLAAGSGYNRNLNLDPERIAGFRNFVNKIWNAYRFIHPFLGLAKDELPKSEKLSHHERWILGELNATTKIMNESLDEFRFDDSCAAIYSFVYDKFCSWFIELSKTILYAEDEAAKIQRATVLRFAFRKIMALLHPFTPYLTEELWEQLKKENEDLLIVSAYPEFDSKLVFEADQNDMNRFIEVITHIRNLRSSMNIKPKDEVNVDLFTDDSHLQKYFKDNIINFFDLAKVRELNIKTKADARSKKAVWSATTHTEVFLPLEGVIDLNDQITRLEKELAKTKGDFERLNTKLSNQNFVNSAPKEVVAESKAKALELKEKVISLETNLNAFKN